MTPSQAPQDVTVRLLLAGGHQYPLTLRSDDPILQELIAALVARSHPEAGAFSALFQIPLQGGQAALCFPSDQLVGLVTEPPLYVQPVVTEPKPVAVPSDVLVSQFVQIDQFLPEAEWRQLVDYVLAQEKNFVPTSTSTQDVDYRRSQILYQFPEVAQKMRDRIRQVVPDVLEKLGLPAFAVQDIEAQLTAHNDGNYYKIHNDNGSPDTATRELTYVYYFYREPKGFRGGELRIYDSRIENNYYVGADSFHTVEPRNNSIVFFLSRYLHEVLPVHCPSRAFADSRFTINGWVRRG